MRKWTSLRAREGQGRNAFELNLEGWSVRMSDAGTRNGSLKTRCDQRHKDRQRFRMIVLQICIGMLTPILQSHLNLCSLPWIWLPSLRRQRVLKSNTGLRLVMWLVDENI